MKKLITALFLSISIFYIFSCSEACEGECLEETNILMRIVSVVDSSDLVFGVNKVFNPEDIRVFSVSGSDSTFNAVNSLEFRFTSFDSILVFDNRDFSISRLFIDYGNSDIDTLNFSFSSIDCCYTYRFLNTTTQNGMNVYNRDIGDVFVTLKK